MPLPEQYQFLLSITSPKIVQEAIKLYGTKEIAGDKNNPVILGWGDELGGWIDEYYTADSIPWCGLFVGVCAKRAGFPFGQKALSALEWTKWGTPVKVPMLGDVLVFKRQGGGHVALYVGEDDTHYHILGGNQSDEVNIVRKPKNQLYAARRCQWKIGQPPSVQQIHLKPTGQDAGKEA